MHEFFCLFVLFHKITPPWQHLCLRINIKLYEYLLEKSMIKKKIIINNAKTYFYFEKSDILLKHGFIQKAEQVHRHIKYIS